MMIFIFVFAGWNTTLAQTHALAGTVNEAKSGEVVIGVTVALYRDTSAAAKPIRGAYTNKYGFYSIPGLANGKYYAICKGVGYRPFKKEITINNNDIRLDIKLTNVDVRTQEVTVEAEASPVSKLSKVTIDPAFVHQLPALFGETDVFRSLQLLPGIKQATELSSGLYIRGGSPDENLTLLDGVIVYNPSHLGGFLSSFNNDALRDIKLIKGAFPAEYGGRLSGVLDMTMKEGTKEKISGSGGISIISSRLTVEGPIGDDVTFMLSGRRMYLDLILALSGVKDAPTYYFYDLNAKTNIKLSESDRIFASGYFGKDVLAPPSNKSYEDDTQFDIFWGNSTANLRWMHIESPELFTNFSLIYTDYSFESKFSQKNNSSNNFYTLSKIEDIMARAEAQYFPAEDHIIKLGAESIFHKFISKATLDVNEFGINENKSIDAVESAIYLQDEWNITPLFSANIGARYYYFNSGKYGALEPRVSLSYILTDYLTLKASAAMVNQNLHLVIRNNITLPTDLWFPSTAKVKPSQSTQYVLGTESKLFDGEYLFTVEGYYRSMGNILEYKPDANFSLGIPLEDQFLVGKGEAFGIEVFLNKKVGSFTGWIGYTLAWTHRQFDGLNNGNWFYPRYDRRHDVSVVLSYTLGKDWEFTASWVYGTGQAFTMPVGNYSFTPIGTGDDGSYWNENYQYSDRNGIRLPAYHKLDVNFMYKYEWFGLPFELSLSLYNAYNQKNPFAWYIQNDYIPGEGSKNKLKQITLFPIIPSFGISFKF
jgi:outer membrane cobalamin receptor